MTSPTVRSRSIWTRVERLCSAAIRITAEHELDRVLQEIADSARDVVGCRYAAIGVLDAQREQLAQFVVSGISDDEYRRIGDPPRGHGILGVLIQDPKPLRLRNLHAHPQSFGFPAQHPPMTSFLGVPVIGRDGPIGNLYLTEKLEAEEFTQQDEAFAVMLAAHAAVAVENARYHEERERLMSTLRSLQLSRDRFFAMINHELRNALTAVHGWAELWLRRVGDDAPRAAREVFESAERAVSFLDDLLMLSRLDAEKMDARFREADLLAIVREAVASVEPAAERRAVALSVEAADGSVACETDPQRVRQVLINLLTNAVRHSPEHGRVTVTVSEEPSDTLCVGVADDGEGIPAEQQLMIFEAFERAGTEADRGTGLGLALSRKLARLLGGDLTVESHPGQGARFMLTLPRRPLP